MILLEQNDTVGTVVNKRAMSKAIDKQVKEFKKKGGKVQKVKTQMSIDCHPNYGRSHKVIESRKRGSFKC